MSEREREVFAALELRALKAEEDMAIASEELEDARDMQRELLMAVMER